MLFFAHPGRESRTIVALDAGNGAVKEFTIDGEFQRQVRFSEVYLAAPYDVFPVQSGGFLVQFSPVSQGSGRVRRSVSALMLADSTGGLTRPVAEIRGPEWVYADEGSTRARLERPFAARPWLSKDRSGCFVHATDDGPGFVVRDENGAVMMEGVLPFVDLSIDRRAWSARVQRQQRSGHPFPALERPEERPAWATGLSDGTRHIWLEEYHHRDEAARGWWVLDLETGLATWVDAPAETAQLLGVIPERVVLLMRNDLEEEDVRIFEVAR